MNSIVADASVFGPLFLDDEGGNLPPAMEGRLLTDSVVAPQHWPLEVANIIQISAKRGRLAAGQVSEARALLIGLSVEIDDETSDNALGSSFDLAQKHSLTIYDAAYLELAIRKNLSLATLDKALARAARAENIEVLTP